MRRVGWFGGSFNPPHVGHLILAEMARCTCDLDEILFMPAKNPPHKHVKGLAPARDRCHMVELAVEDNDAFTVSRLELDREGPSYTLRTARELTERLSSDARLFLILGADSVRDLPEWWKAGELLTEMDFIVLRRPGHPMGELSHVEEAFGRWAVEKLQDAVVEAPLLDISSTSIRQRVAAGGSIRYLVPDAVRHYIREQDMY
jgi:nicotinate-nucleotide adenylyltransferase